MVHTPLNLVVRTSQHVILKRGRGQHTKYTPYAFTRNGIGMLSSVLRSETAVEVNIRIMRAFTTIPDIVNNNMLMMQQTKDNDEFLLSMNS